MMTRALLLLTAAMAAAGCIQTGVVCNAPNVQCAGSGGASQVTCVNLQSDPAHCGSCAVTCGTGEACVGGLCQCPPNTQRCGNACVDVQSDARHCGGCEETCGATDLCQTGECVSVCQQGYTGCGTSCVDLDADPRHCGTCAAPCAQGQSCVAGVCQATLVAACFNTGELVALDDQLVPQASSVIVGGGPQSLAAVPGRVLVADTVDNALYRADPTKAPLAKDAGGDRLGMAVNQVLVKGSKAFALNSLDNNVQVIDLAKTAPGAIDNTRTVDQVPTALGGASAANTNPYFGAFVGAKLYVTLLGSCYPDPSAGDAAGNRVLEIDTAASPAQVTRQVVFAAASLEKDAAAAANSPRPSGIAAVGTTLFVALGNLSPDCMGAAGPGYLAIVDTAADPMAVKYLKLPEACRNTGSVVASGPAANNPRVYVGCLGSYGFGGEALVVVDAISEQVLSTTLLPAGRVPGRMTLTPDKLVIADGGSGRLFATDLSGALLAGYEQGVSICGPGASGYQMTSDVVSLR